MKHAREKKSVKSDFTRTRREKAEKETKRAVGERTERTSSVKPETKAYFEEKRKNKKQQKNNIFWKKTRIAVIICICIALIVVLGVGSGMYAAISREVDELDFEGIAYNSSSIVYANDKDGNSVEVEFLHDDGNREWIDSDKIPDIARQAAISIEDERFEVHKGVDLKRTTGAVFGWLTSKITKKSPSYGGSTITQQVIKNITNEKDKTVTRKVKEMMRAIAFEKRFTKEEILTTYLNISYFGNQCYGIEPAAKMYFSKNAIDLTLPEAAMIVGITQAPARFDPYKNPENCKAKRDTVLKKMYELGKISEDEYNKAVKAPLGVNKTKKTLHSTVYNYFVDQVINDVIEDLRTEKGYSEDFAKSQVFGGGLKIYTTMDSGVQDAIESVYENTANFPGASAGVQSAMVIIDPKTGEIKGMAGGIGTKTESRGLNRATQSRRQPGSSEKPLSVYAPSLEEGKITAATIITDSPITIGSWSPKNSYSGYKGDMSVRRAIEISANTPAVKTLQTLGIDKSYDYMTKKFGFTSLTEDDKNLSALGLGGMTKGVSPKEMAAAYATFANEGVYITPHTYTKVLDRSGKVLLQKKTEERRVISEANAFIMTSFLKEVVNGSGGTGRNAKLSKVTTYGKTGTTNDSHDKWFCGFTTRYVGAVWYGYDSKRSVGGTNVATQIWKKVMEKVHEGMTDEQFEQPSNVTAVSVCQLTGKLSSAGCSHAKTEYFARGTLPTKYCNNNHKGVVGARKDTTDKTTTEKKPQSTGDEEENIPDDDISEGTSTPPKKPAANEGTTSTQKPESPPKPADDGAINLD